MTKSTFGSETQNHFMSFDPVGDYHSKYNGIKLSCKSVTHVSGAPPSPPIFFSSRVFWTP